MKVTKAMLVYLITFIIGYLLLSSIGCIFYKDNLNHYSYSECLGSINWSIFYFLMIGWWVSAIVAVDYYETATK